MTEIDTRIASCNMDNATAVSWPDVRDADSASETASHLVEAIFDFLAEARDRARNGAL